MKVDVKENAEAIQKLMIAITKLELQIENLTRIIAKTEKLEKDMHEASHKFVASNIGTHR